MNIPITQSKAWQKLQDDLGEQSFYEETPDYSYLAILKKTPVGNYLYLPYGPVADTSKSFERALESLLGPAKATSAMFIRVEPKEPSAAQILQNNGTLLVGSTTLKIIKSKDLNPKETWLLDLPGTPIETPLENGELKAKLPSRLLRYYKSREKQGITIETSHNPKDICHLLKLQRALAEKKGINTFSEHYLETELSQPFATLYLVKYQNPDAHQEKIIAAGLVFDDATTRYNLQGAQTEQGRKLHATGILTIQLILDATVAGKQVFDFWGIAPDGAPADHPWAGFTAFKKTFAGHEADFAGTYDLVLSPNKYKLYRLLRKLHH
ncbi:peptidoglycan bridge formation glycyltransferase FemA/FemB family protein [Candidatus Saccharibacteria bacterium]|nr:peptidoglycan bridge formation glycyltransferase FemA/FemB family protein [Candidatus Saccharibacteria bacterium]